MFAHQFAVSPTRLFLLVLVLMTLPGCLTTQRTSYPARDADLAQVQGYGTIRAFADQDQTQFGNAADWKAGTSKRDIHLLSLSGGGSGGAFAAGILSAWSRKRTRPEFDIVTGVSTGALMAPFAFLGPGYDRKLTALYTSDQPSDLVEINWRGAGLFGASILTGASLRALVDENVTPSLMMSVAAEHRKGRRLLVMTTNLDSQRAVVWNMGLIATSGRSDALDLFRNVLIASASIPGVFPSVMIKTRIGDRLIEEMHSDGGSASQFFSIPNHNMIHPTPRTLGKRKRLHLYVIINNALMPEFGMVTNSAFSVMGRAYAVLIKSQAKHALVAVYNYAQREGITFHVASIDEQIPYSIMDPFNADYMRTLYRLGYSRTMAGEIWREKPDF